MFNMENLTVYRYDEQERVMSNRMVYYWTNFAKYGNPNGDLTKVNTLCSETAGILDLKICGLGSRGIRQTFISSSSFVRLRFAFVMKVTRPSHRGDAGTTSGAILIGFYESVSLICWAEPAHR